MTGTAFKSKGYGDFPDTVFGPQSRDGLRRASVRPLAPFLLLMAHGDLHPGKDFSREHRRDAAQADNNTNKAASTTTGNIIW